MMNNLNISLYLSYHVKYLCISVVGNRWSDDGAGFKAALLSGPPGVGKTTTATLVCKVSYQL